MNHNKGLFWILCVLCLMMVVIGCSKRKKDDVVARIGDKEVILLSEFRDHFSRGKKKEERCKTKEVRNKKQEVRCKK